MTTIAVREARLKWGAPTGASPNLIGLAGYRIHYGTASKTYTKAIAVSGATTLQRTVGLAPGTWYFAVAALNSVGKELARSNEVRKAIP